MAAYRRVYDSHHLQAECQEPGSAPEPYALQSSMRYLFYYTHLTAFFSEQPGQAGNRKVKNSLDLNEARDNEVLGYSGIR